MNINVIQLPQKNATFAQPCSSVATTRGGHTFYASKLIFIASYVWDVMRLQQLHGSIIPVAQCHGRTVRYHAVQHIYYYCNGDHRCVSLQPLYTCYVQSGPKNWTIFTARPHCWQCGRAVIATADLYVCLSVRLSDTFRCFIQINEDTIGRSSAAGRTTILVSEEIGLTFIRIFAGDHPSEGAKVRHSPATSENLTNNQP